MGTLCELFGKTRQAYYQHIKYNYTVALKEEILLQMIHKERKKMPRLGGRKLLHKIQPQLSKDLYLGRDLLFSFLRDHGLLVRRRRNRAITTYSKHWLRKYPNLIKGIIPQGPNQHWVADITYIRIKEGFVYLSLITDAYSRKIIGWSLGITLEARHSLEALKMALKQLPRGVKGVYHHSDRGVQYCSQEYVNILQHNNFQISMTENGDPLENAIAERVNGILKDEWLNQIRFQTIDQVKDALVEIIKTYNTERPHCSINFLTPQMAHQQSGVIKRKWKNYYKVKPKEVLVE
jgi:transposase InsO family protein